MAMTSLVPTAPQPQSGEVVVSASGVSECWWKDLLRLSVDKDKDKDEKMKKSIDAITSIKQLLRFGYNRFFREEISKALYHHICVVAFLAQMVEDGCDPHQLWRIIRQTIQTGTGSGTGSGTTQGSSCTLTQMVLPSMEDFNVAASPSASTTDSFSTGRGSVLDRLVGFFIEFFNECEKPSSPPQRKRLKLSNHLLSGRYQLPTAYLLTTLIYSVSKNNSPSTSDATPTSNTNMNSNTQWHTAATEFTWQWLESEVHRRLKPFQTMNPDDIRGGLAVLGLELLKCAGPTLPEGLTPTLVLEAYISRMGESLLSKLKDATGLDFYWLRAFLSDHLLQPVFADSMSIDQQDQTIALCSFFINRESHQTYLCSLNNTTTSPIKDQPLSYPVIRHIGLWLLRDDVDRAMQMLLDLEACPYIDEACKDFAWLHIWQHLLRAGKVFLDGNINSPGYYAKRELLYNGVVFGMCAIGREATMAFFQGLAEKVWNHPNATQPEKTYVLKACQQTLLRILFKCKGLGSSTIHYFLENTEWPVAISAAGFQDRDLEQWAENFLKEVVPTPSSLLDEDQLLDLEHLVEIPYEHSPEPKFLLVAAEDDEQFLHEEAHEEGRADTEAQVALENTDEEELDEPVEEEVVEVLDSDEEAQDANSYEQEEIDEIEIVDSNEEEENVEEEPSGVITAGDGIELEDGDSEEEESVAAVDEEQENVERAAAPSETFLGSFVDGSYYDYADEADKESDIEFALMQPEGSREHTGDECAEDKSTEYNEAVVREDKEIDEEIVEDGQQDEMDRAGEYDDVLVIQEDPGDGEEGIPPTLPQENSKLDDQAAAETSLPGVHGFRETYQPLAGHQDEPVDESPVKQNTDTSLMETRDELSPMKSPEDTSSQTFPHGTDARRLDDQDGTVEVNEQSPSKGKLAGTDSYQATIDDYDRQSIEDKGSTRIEGAVDSDATDDEQERALEVEKAETEVAAVGGEFGDTTEEEEDGDGKANRAAMANRTADLRASMGYASQLEEGYEPEDTHGYTEEEVSEAIHTEDEEEDRRKAQETRAMETEPSETNNVTPVPRKTPSNPHSSDDMDAADEHTEQEEDLGAESSELEESTEVQRYSASYSPSEHQGDPKALWEYAQTAQRQHDSLQKAADEELAGEGDKCRSAEPCADKSVGFVDADAAEVDYSGGPYGTEGSKSRDSEPTESEHPDPVIGAYTESETNDEAKADTITKKALVIEEDPDVETDKSYSQAQNLPTILEDTESALEVDGEGPSVQAYETEDDLHRAAESTEAVQGSVVDSNDGVVGAAAEPPTPVEEDEAAPRLDPVERNGVADDEAMETRSSNMTTTEVVEGTSLTSGPPAGNTTETLKADDMEKAVDVSSPEEKLTTRRSSRKRLPKKYFEIEGTADDIIGPAQSMNSGKKETSPTSGTALSDEDSEAQADKEDNSVVSETSGTRGRSASQPEAVVEQKASPARKRGRATKRQGVTTPSRQGAPQAERDSKDLPSSEAEPDNATEPAALSPPKQKRGQLPKKQVAGKSVSTSASSLGKLARRNASAGEAEEIASATSSTPRRSTRRKTRQTTAEDDMSVASSVAEEDEKDDGSHPAPATSLTPRRSTRRKNHRKSGADDASVASSAAEDDEQDDDTYSVASSTRRSTRRSARSKTGDEDDESIVSSVGSRRSSRLKSKQAEGESGDESIATASVGSRTRRAKRQTAALEELSEDESVGTASVSSRTRRAAKTKPVVEDSPVKKKRGRPRKNASPAKGRPPLPPATRHSARTNKRTRK